MSQTPGNYSLAESLALLPESERAQIIQGLTDQQITDLSWDWHTWARPNQLQPAGSWLHWLLLAGRGFGKTKTGGETVRQWARDPLPAPIHLVAPTAGDIRKVMVEGPSGLLSCYPPGEGPIYEPSKGHLLTWANGNTALCFSADEPERLRGPQCCRYWADELAAWRFLDDAWDNLQFGFRIGDDLRGVITTTPKPLKLIKELAKNPSTAVTRGSTYENRAHLAPAFFREVIRKYEGTRLGRQELNAEILEDVEGALWTRALIEASRVPLADVPALYRAVVAIDPAVSAKPGSNETGIVCVGAGYPMIRRGLPDGRVILVPSPVPHAYVLADRSFVGKPLEWAHAALQLFLKFNCDRLVGEVNNGGDLVEANLRTVHPDVPYRAVVASKGKQKRNEPVSALYEQGRVHHVIMGAGEGPHAPASDFARLEDQMCEWVPGADSDASPDRLDALAWAIFDLIVQPSEQALIQLQAGVQISAI